MKTKTVDYSTHNPPPPLDELPSYQLKTPFENDDDIKVISLEELLSFDRKSFSPTIDWPGDTGPAEMMSDGITNSTEEVKVNRSDEKTPYDPVEENITPPPLLGYRGGQLLICGNRNGINVRKDNRNVCNNANDLRQLPKLTAMMDFSESDSNSSVFSIPDDRDIFGGNMYGDDISDDAGPEDWSS